MAAQQLGPGERIARRNRRRMYYFIGACSLLGGILGGATSLLEIGGHHGFHDVSGMRLPPIAAVALALGLVVALIALPVYAFRLVDEVKVRQSLQAMSGGCLAVIGGYPAWQVLAAGGLLPQPSALGVFLIAYGAMGVLLLAFRIRG